MDAPERVLDVVLVVLVVVVVLVVLALALEDVPPLVQMLVVPLV